MSQPTIPNITPQITVTEKDTVNLLLTSIALEEMSLAHIMNAEAEKIQFILGTLNSTTRSPEKITNQDLLKINQSVLDMMHEVILTEILLQMKFSNVLRLVEKQK